MYVFVLNVLSSEFSLNENFYYYFAHTEFLSVNFGKGKIHLGELFFFYNYLCTLFCQGEVFTCF